MIIKADSIKIPMASNSVHCVITSPPYWGLRDYGISGQLGLERTPDEYISKMVQVFREVKRVLRADGTLWLNMGDSYASQGGPEPAQTKWQVDGASKTQNAGRSRTPGGLKPKDLCGIPWRLAFALQADGWYLRSDIIWAKPNPMPESISGCAWERHRIKVSGGERGKEPQRVGSNGKRPQQDHDGKNFSASAKWEDCAVGCEKCTPNDGYVLSWNAGRPTKAHEYIFLFTKKPQYFFDAQAVREPMAETSAARYDYSFGGAKNEYLKTHDNPTAVVGNRIVTNGRNIRTVWNIATQPFSGAHFATFPEELVRRCLFAGSSERGVCPKCGGPWVRVMEKGNLIPDSPEYKPRGNVRGDSFVKNAMTPRGETQGHPNFHYETKTLGWRPSCKCGEERTVPAIVLDPFFGAGTVGIVAQKYNRRFIGLELKPEYCRMAQSRIKAGNVGLL